MLLVFVVSVLLATGLTFVVRKGALSWRALDRPDAAPERKIHQQPTPLFGGLAIFLAFWMVVGGLAIFGGLDDGPYIGSKHLWGMFFASAVLMIGGVIDDKRNISPGRQIWFPLLAAVILIISGIGIRFITNPFGGVIPLDDLRFRLFDWQGVPYYLTLWADLFTMVWILGMTYTTKFLDGLDGLVSGVTAIGALTIFFLSIRPPVLQNETATLALILAGVCLGFLVWNWHPAKIFLGEGGSLVTGFLLGTLAIIAGSKVATALLIMGIPILDVAWVIVRRAFFEHRSPFRTSDRKHLHFRLLDVGLSHRQAVGTLLVLTAVAGTTTLFFHGLEKLLALIILAVLMLVFGGLLVWLAHRRMDTRQ